jgi:hypothetical protein
MRRVSQFLPLVLLVLWFPATQCCALEAAGLVPRFCCDDGCARGEPCAKDACASLGSVPDGTGAVVQTVSAPELRDATSYLGIVLVPSFFEPAMIMPAATIDPPGEWVAAWHFLRRAAPPSRAPAFRFA